MRYLQRLKKMKSLLSLVALAVVIGLCTVPHALSAPTEQNTTQKQEVPVTTPPVSTTQSQAPTAQQAPQAPQAAEAPQAPQAAEVAGAYSGNAASKVFHKQGCRYFSCKACTVRFTSPADAAAKGFKPCKVCMK